MKKYNIKKILKYMLYVILGIIVILFVYFFVGFPKENPNVSWGVNFSQKHAQSLGIKDWKKAYTDILDEMGVRNLKIGTYWDYHEWKPGEYHFNELDWQIQEAEKRNAEIILVIGMKTIGWPECHLPEWAKKLSKEDQQASILKYLEQMVLRYKDSKAIKYWQVENEPFFPFGECPWKDKAFLKKEIDLVRSLDPTRKIIISESGEFPLWFKAAKYGDIVGTTMYKKVWFNDLNSYITYPFPAVFYKRKAMLIKALFGKEVINVEFQAEPWGPALIYHLTLEEQKKSMDLERFKKNIKFARKTGIDEFYFWGAEWWYWMKENQNQPEIWDEAKKLF